MIRNNVNTYRVEVLSFIGDGLAEDQKWSLLAIRNDEKQAREFLNRNEYVRIFKCTSNGREMIASNIQEE